MNGISKWLKDKQDNIIIPNTLTTSVYNSDGQNVDELLSLCGGSTGITITEAEYLAKKDEYDADGNVYFISDGYDGISAKDMPFDDTTTRLGVDNVQDSITLVNNKAVNALATANNKADYETGTFKLRWEADVTYTLLSYNYIKIGNLVIVYGTGYSDDGFTVGASSSNHPTYSGLPFPVRYGNETYFYFGTNQSYRPSNIVDTNLDFTIENSALVLHGDVTIQQQQPLMLFGIYLTY